MTPVPVLQAPSARSAPSLREQKKARTRAALHDSAARLVAESGLARVTVEEICAQAEVSPRTFFNYYPSKAAAVLGLPDAELLPAARAAFLAARGNLVRDCCDLVASVFDGPGRLDKSALHELLQRHPELQPELHSWLTDVRRGLAELVAERSDPDRARSALALVLAAVAETAQRDGGPGRTGERLWASVQAMVAEAVEPAAG